MHGSPYAALDAGIPTDAPFVEDKPDNRDDAELRHRNMVKRMVWWLRVAGGPDGPTTDKMDAATQLARHGFTAADILDNLDEVIGRIEFEEKTIKQAVARRILDRLTGFTAERTTHHVGVAERASLWWKNQ